MAERLPVRKYAFTVEGETEQWYLLWLRNQINNFPERTSNVSFKVVVQQSPRRFYKGLVKKTNPYVTHICDVESNEFVHVEKLHKVLTEMRDAKDQKGIEYKLGYSNYAFELWMALHKTDCSGPLTNRSQYLGAICQAFGERFEDLDHYKAEDAFKRCLSKLTINDVRTAIRRAEKIMIDKMDDPAMKMERYKGYSYYKENPSLSIHEVVRLILEECGIV